MIIGCPRCHLRYDISQRDPSKPIQCRCGASFHVPNVSNTARAWNCPNCGGTTDPGKNQCDFCGVYLAFARCPDCFSLAFEGAKFCHQCGGNLHKAALSAEDDASDLSCPRCQHDLLSRAVEGYQIDHCQHCGGLWLEHQVLQKLLDARGQQKAAETYLRNLKPQTPVTPDKKVVYLKCPDCEQLMHRRNFGQSSGIIVDECAAHGIWFDADELAGAIDFARRTREGVVAKQTRPEAIAARAKQEVVLNRPDSEVNLWSSLGEVFERIVDRW